jgi:hypothetical protein
MADIYCIMKAQEKREERKRERKMEKMIFYISDCCGVESDKDHMVCSRCGEHCEIVVDDSMESDYIPGYDDGEAC